MTMKKAERLEKAMEFVLERIAQGGEWPNVSATASIKFNVPYEAIREAYDKQWD